MDRKLTIACFGGGSNSSALLIGAVQKQIPVDLILFADTGCERPETYCHVEQFSAWLQKQGYPAITTVQQVNKAGEKITLEEDCLRLEQMPSLVYGFKSCSQKFKLFPQNKYLNNWEPAKKVWAEGGKILKFVGFDAGEHHRIKEYSDDKFYTRYLLVEWGWNRERCIDEIEKVGLRKPGKSSCFCCPSMRKAEISAMKYQHPELMARAVKIEDAALANAKAVAGLGRHFNWKDFLKQGDLFPEMYPESYIDEACGCYDG